MLIRVKKLRMDARIPEKSRGSDAGWDLFSTGHVAITNGLLSILSIHTGIAVEIPEGYFGLIAGRSGLALHGIDILGGVIDSGYRGEVVVIGAFHYMEARGLIRYGVKVAQMLILPVLDVMMEEAEDLSESDRGTRGFGSSGR